MTDWHEEIGKRLISIETKISIQTVEWKTFKKRVIESMDDLNDSVGVLIENHKLLFEVFPYLRADLNDVRKCLVELLTLAKEYATGIEPNIYG